MADKRDCSGVPYLCFTGDGGVHEGLACSSDADCGGTQYACRPYFSGNPSLARCAGRGESIALYPASDCLIESSISEGRAAGTLGPSHVSLASASAMIRTCDGGRRDGRACNYADDCPGGACSGASFVGGQRNVLFNSVVFEGRVQPRAYPAGGGYDGAEWGEDSAIRQTVIVAGNATDDQIQAQSQKSFVADHVSAFGGNSFGIEIGDRGDKACALVPGGCSVTVSNSSVVGAPTKGLNIHDQTACTLAHVNAFASGPDAIQDVCTGSVDHADPAFGACYLWAPSTSPLRGAGTDGSDIGATVLYRSVDGVLTGKPLWSKTGKFPCGAVVEGVNDGEARCSNVGTRLRINQNGCEFPAGYVGW